MALCCVSCSTSTTLQQKIIVDVSEQKLYYKGKSYPISTAWRGTGQRIGSKKTPLGQHTIVRKIPANCNHYKGRVRGDKLWLAGDDCPINRYIYIHPTRNPAKLGRPASIGCVHTSWDVANYLLRSVPVGTPVVITP